MTHQRKQWLEQKMARRLTLSLIAGAVGILALFAAYWGSLLLINYHPAFIPNSERRMAMYRFLNHQPRQGVPWLPRQGEHWIF